MITRRRQLACKVETTEGTAIALVNTDVVLCSEPVFTKGNDFYRRNNAKASLSAEGGVVGKRPASIKFKCELKGSGTKGTAPEWGKLLRACGFTEAIVAVTSVTYTPASSSIPSLTMAVYEDGKIKKAVGCRGTVKFTHKTGQPVMMEFEFQGAFHSDVEGAMLTGVSYDATVPPAFLSASLTVDSYDALISSLDLDIANKLAVREDANGANGLKSCKITSREGVGSFDPESTPISGDDGYDFHTKMDANTQFAFTETIGSVDGNKFIITAPKMQYAKISPSDREGVAVDTIELALGLNSGDDELSIQQL